MSRDHIAGEPFGDAPESVCPVIAAFLRTYNDRLGDCRRQDLYEYAAKAVGTRSTKEAERVRAKCAIAGREGSTEHGSGTRSRSARRRRARRPRHRPSAGASF